MRRCYASKWRTPIALMMGQSDGPCFSCGSPLRLQMEFHHADDSTIRMYHASMYLHHCRDSKMENPIALTTAQSDESLLSPNGKLPRTIHVMTAARSFHQTQTDCDITLQLDHLLHICTQLPELGGKSEQTIGLTNVNTRTPACPTNVHGTRRLTVHR